MHVLLVLGHWRPIGGSERHGLELAEGLHARGLELTVLDGGGDAPVPGAGGPSWRRAHRVTWEPLADRAAPERRGELAGLLAGVGADVCLLLSPVAPWVAEELGRALPLVRFVQDHTYFCPGLNKLRADGSACREPLGAACRAALLRGGCHDLRPGRGALARVAEREREVRREAASAHFVVASGYMYGQLVTSGVPEARVHTVPYPTRAADGSLPPEPLPAVLERWLAADTAPVLVAAARLVLPDKGLDRLLEALARLTRPARLVLAGEGPARARLEALARDLGVAGRVAWPGWLSAGQMESLYPRARAAVFPSTWDEPFGLVGLEALAHGLPVAAFDVGGVAQWLHEGRGGTRVPRGDVAGLARALDAWLANPELARLVGAAGRARVEAGFRLEAHLRGLLPVLEAARAERAERAASTAAAVAAEPVA